MLKLAVCLAVHNRRHKTLTCLASLQAASIEDLDISIFLLDDGSADGTREAVSSRFPDVTILQGDGQQYWAGGMRAAYGAALLGAYDLFMWLNDDVELNPDALRRLITCQQERSAKFIGDQMIVGAVADRADGAITYSGLSRARGFRSWKLLRVQPSDEEAVECDTVNGNVVLIPNSLARSLGNIDPVFTHAFGDLDYGFRAKRAGARIWIAPGIVGYCAANTERPRWNTPGLNLRERFKRIMSPLGVPMSNQFHYAFKHFGMKGPIFAIAPYASLLAVHVIQKFRSRSA